MEGCHRFLPDTELEGANTEQRRLDEKDRGGHGPKTGRRAVVEWGGGREQRRLEEGDRGGHGPKTGRSAIAGGGGGGRSYMLRAECCKTNEP